MCLPIRNTAQYPPVPALSMHRAMSLICFLLCTAAFSCANDDPVIFKTDVSLTRVDARVTDGQGRVITGLGVQDFVLSLNGKPLTLKSVASEDVPIDILLLLDVSGSMEPHVQRIASAARQALGVLTEKDRVAVMIFDTRTTVRLPFRSNHSDVTAELNRILRSEHFAGGTRITSAMLDAARYLGREARPDARRAIVILTDDQTQDEEDEALVGSALTRANAVLSFLQAPYEVPAGYGRGGGTGGGRRGGGGGTWGGGGGWPGMGGGWPGTGGGGGVGFPGRRGPGGGMGGDRSHTAGTATIAEDSGGDTMRVEEASALEDTLARLRQRYALYCYLHNGMKLEDGQAIRVGLSQEAEIMHRNAQVQSRRVYMAGASGTETSGPASITRARTSTADTPDSQAPALIINSTTDQPRKGPRKAVNEDSGEKINTVTPP